MIEKIFKPSVKIFNQLKFKTKIVIVGLILFLPIIYPTYNYIQVQYEKKDDINKTFIGLQYNNYIYNYINLLTKHRGLLYRYNHLNKKDILLLETKIEQKVEEYIKFDKEHLNILSINSNFIQLATFEWENIKLNNLQKDFDKDTVFQKHTKLINNLISMNQIRANKTHFFSKVLPKLNYIANVLSYQIPTLSELTGRLRGIVTKVFLEKKITQKEKNEIIGLTSTINEKLKNTKNSKLLLSNNRYFKLNKNILNIIKEFTRTTNIIDKHIIKEENLEYDSKKFFSTTTQTITKIDDYYKNLKSIFKDIAKEKLSNINKNIIYVFMGLSIITFIITYIIISLYISIVNSLKILKTTSISMANGEYDKEISYEGRDEIAEAIKTFNTISHQLKNNMTFLDNYKYAIDNTSIVSKTDKKGIITYVNKQFCQISGYSKKELLGKPHNIVRHPDMPKEAFKDMWQTIKNGKTWKGIVKNKKKNGDYYIVDATIIPMHDNKGNFVEYVAVRHDITDIEKQNEAQLYDNLTKLPKREKLLSDIKKTTQPTLLLLNIDNFSSLNKFYGYENADKVLIYLSDLLEKLFKNIGGKVYKLHADEFAILFNTEGLTKKALHELVSNYINIIEDTDIECNDTYCINISLHSGLALYEEGTDKEELQLNADIALKYAKKEHKKLVIFNSKINNKNSYIENMAWIKKIENALKNDKIIPYFQPIIDNKSDTIKKYESLVRMIDDDGKVISPYFFLDIAKKANLYHKITKVMIEKTFKKFEKHPNLEFSINLTTLDINNKDVVEFIFKKLKNYTNTERIIFEIVESEDIDNYEKVELFIKDIKRYGVKIAIDDFGSGFSSFERILKLKPNYIKIDGSIIKDIDKNEDAKVITNAIIAFSHNLGLKVIAEYIHSETIQDMVCHMWCDYSQGFYLGEPSPSLKGIEELVVEKEELETA